MDVDSAVAESPGASWSAPSTTVLRSPRSLGDVVRVTSSGATSWDRAGSGTKDNAARSAVVAANFTIRPDGVRAAEAGPAFSPDGRLLAYSVQREGDAAPQIYVLDLQQGGEPRRVTSLSTGARQPQFSPDGSRLLFVSSVYPGTKNDADNQRIAAERKARKDNVRIYTGFPIRNWDRWLDDRQQRLFVVPVAGGEALDLLAGSALVTQPGFGGRFSDTGEEIDATWTPDGQSVVFAATVNRHRAAFANVHTDLYRVSASGGEAVRLTGDGTLEAQDSYARPQFSPDGRTLLAQRTPRGEQVYQPTHLQPFDWPAMRPGTTLRLPGERVVNGFGIDADSRTVWLTAEDAGHEKLWRARLGEPEARLAFDMDRGVYTGLQVARRASGVLVANYDSAAEPPEVVRLMPRGGHQPLSAFNRERAAALDLAPAETFWFESDRGARIPTHAAPVGVGRPGADGGDSCPQGGGVGRAQQEAERNVHLVGVAVIPGPVGEPVIQGLGEQVEIRGRLAAEGVQLVPAQNVEDLEQDVATVVVTEGRHHRHLVQDVLGVVDGEGAGGHRHPGRSGCRPAVAGRTDRTACG